MTPETPQQALDAFEALIAKAREAGDALAEADARARKAAVYTQQGEWPPGIDELQVAARLARQAGRLDLCGQYLYGLGLLLGRVPERRSEAERAWRDAAAAAGLAHDLPTRVKAGQRIVGLYAEAQDWMQAIAELTVVVTRLEQEPPSDDLVQSLRLRAMFHQARGRYDRGLTDLDHAVEVATATGDARLALQVRLERRVLRAFLRTEGEPEPFTALIDEARSIGDQGLLGDLHFEQATQAVRDNRLEEALSHADNARQAALSAPDPLRYLLACMVIAEAREKLGDRPGVLEILLTCKTTMEDYLGKPAGQQVRLILDSLARDDRWGEAGVAKALAVYRERMKNRIAEA